MSKIFLATMWNGVARAALDNNDVWQVERRLDGMDVRAVAADPLSPGVVYAGTDKHGVWCSSNSGKDWDAVGLEGEAIRSLAVNPIRSGVVYAGTKPPGLFVSYNGGATWEELAAFRKMRRWWWFTPAERGAEYVQSIALSPTNQDVILAGIEFGAVLRSEDGGRTWSGHRKGALRDCHTMIFHARDGNWAYECGGGGSVVSRDGGLTWSHPRKGREAWYGWAVGADPERPEVWYISVARGPGRAHGSKSADALIYRMTGGAAWERVGGGLPQPLEHMPYALLTDPDAPGQLWVGLSNGDVWHGTDYGNQWEKLPFNLGGIHRSMVMIDNP